MEGHKACLKSTFKLDKNVDMPLKARGGEVQEALHIWQ